MKITPRKITNLIVIILMIIAIIIVLHGCKVTKQQVEDYVRENPAILNELKPDKLEPKLIRGKDSIVEKFITIQDTTGQYQYSFEALKNFTLEQQNDSLRKLLTIKTVKTVYKERVDTRIVPDPTAEETGRKLGYHAGYVQRGVEIQPCPQTSNFWYWWFGFSLLFLLCCVIWYFVKKHFKKLAANKSYL